MSDPGVPPEDPAGPTRPDASGALPRRPLGTSPVLTADLLASSARIMRERGLAKWAYFDPDGSCCILGAVALARGWDPPADVGDWTEEFDAFVEEPLAELSVLLGRDAVAFSDDEDVAASDVANALTVLAGVVRDRG